MYSSILAKKIPANSNNLISVPVEMPLVTGRRRRILIADDHAIFRECLARLLQGSPELDIVGNAEDGQKAVELATLLHPDVVLMDVDMPLMNGIEATRQITLTLPHIRVIGLSMHNHDDIAAQMLSAGAIRYLMKGGPVEELLAAIQF
jgi:DNA-binding NarL/FixJ family response regulator